MAIQEDKLGQNLRIKHMSIQLNLEGHKDVPPEVRGWNWGAFLLTWIWGICNGTYIALLSLIPIVHFAMAFVLGAKGNEWAWRNKDWKSVEEFHRAQRRWAAWGIGLWLLLITVCIGLPMLLLAWGIKMEMPEIKSMISDFSPQRRYCNYALAAVEHEARYREYFGGPIQVRGRGEATLNENGYGEVALPIRGPKGEGMLYLRTHKQPNGETTLERAELELKGLERQNIENATVQQEMQNVERRIAELVSARKKHVEWRQRDPNGREEAEEIYKNALRQAKENSTVRSELGNEITGQIESAKFDAEGPAGRAVAITLLKGNGKTAIFQIDLIRSMGVWRIEGIPKVKMQDGRLIEL